MASIVGLIAVIGLLSASIVIVFDASSHVRVSELTSNSLNLDTLISAVPSALSLNFAVSITPPFAFIAADPANVILTVFSLYFSFIVGAIAVTIVPAAALTNSILALSYTKLKFPPYADVFSGIETFTVISSPTFPSVASIVGLNDALA